MTVGRAVVQRVFPGDLLSDETFEVTEKEKPRSVGAGKVLVKLTVRPVHPIDLLIIRTGELQRFKDQGVTLGSEGTGVVEAIGEGVASCKPGQRVVPILFWKYFRGGIGGVGAWQDYVEVEEEDVVLVPDSVLDEEAAQYVINPWTAHGLLVDVGVPKGEYLLLTAAASVLGRQIIQIAKHWGIRPIAVVRRGNVKEELKAIGACHVINSTSEDIVSTVKDITGGKGAFAALDGVAGVTTKSVASSVKNGGKVFIFGALSGSECTLSLPDLIRHVEVRWWMLTDYLQSPANYERTKKEVMELLVSRALQPLVGKKFHLSAFKEAIRESQRDSRGGKVLLID